MWREHWEFLTNNYSVSLEVQHAPANERARFCLTKMYDGAKLSATICQTGLCYPASSFRRGLFPLMKVRAEHSQFPQSPQGSARSNAPLEYLEVFSTSEALGTAAV